MRFLIVFFAGLSIVFCQTQPKPEDTEVWEPEPIKVSPGLDGAPSSDALVLFDGTNLSQWKSWIVMTIEPIPMVKRHPFTSSTFLWQMHHVHQGLGKFMI